MASRTIALSFLAFLVVADMPLIIPVQAVRKNLPPFQACFAVEGMDPHGVTHVAYFYRRAAATRLAAAWVAAGWLGVMIDSC